MVISFFFFAPTATQLLLFVDCLNVAVALVFVIVFVLFFGAAVSGVVGLVLKIFQEGEVLKELFTSNFDTTHKLLVGHLFHESMDWVCTIIIVNGFEYGIMGGFQSLHNPKIILYSRIICYYVSLFLIFAFKESNNIVCAIYLTFFIGHLLNSLLLLIARVCFVGWQFELSHFTGKSENETANVGHFAKQVKEQLYRIKLQLANQNDDANSSDTFLLTG